MKYKKLKNIVSRKITDGPHVSPEYVDYGIPFISGSEISNGKIILRKNTKMISEDLHNSFYKRTPTRYGDILLVKNGTIGNCAFVDVSFKFSIWVPLALIRMKKQYNSKYVFYNIVSSKTQNYLKENASDAAQPNISISTINNILIYDISLSRQSEIANFLDENCSKIDSEISLLEKKSELLEEYKQSLIFETVTKGLDKNAEMKYSGIDWIGTTPKHWKIKRIKNIFNSLGGGNYGEDENVGMINLPCISISDFKNGNIINTDKIVSLRSYNKDNKLKKGTILLEKSGGGEKNPVGRVIYLLNDINAHYTNFVQGLKSVEDSKFSYYLMKSIHSNKFHMNFVKQNTGLQNFNYNGFSKLFFISIPPKNEQIDIVNFLDEETQKIENKIALISKKIELLKEYKQSLIHEAVTGQLEI